MKTLQDLLNEKAALERAIAEAQSESRTAALEQIRALMKDNGLTVADLAPAKPTKTAATRGKPVAAKYRDGAGNQWSGRGLKPKWLTTALAEGKSLADFAV